MGGRADKTKNPSQSKITLLGQEKYSCGATRLGVRNAHFVHTDICCLLITEGSSSVAHTPKFPSFPIALGSPFSTGLSPRSHHPRLSEERGTMLTHSSSTVCAIIARSCHFVKQEVTFVLVWRIHFSTPQSMLCTIDTDLNLRYNNDQINYREDDTI